MYRRVSFGKREASKSECEMFVKPIFWHKLWHHIFVTICGASVLVATLGGKVFWYLRCFRSFATWGTGFYCYLQWVRFLCYLGEQVLSLFAVRLLSLLPWGRAFCRHLQCFHFFCYIGEKLSSPFEVLPLSLLSWGELFVAICVDSTFFPVLGKCLVAIRNGLGFSIQCISTTICWWQNDTEGIRTPAGRAQWISSPSP